MIKALFFDIDGTLVSFQTHRIPESTIEVLTLAREKGLKLFISTGRPPLVINNLGDFPFDGFITMNGSYCYDHQGTVIYKSSIPASDIQILSDILEKEKQCPCIAVTPKQLYIINRNERVDYFTRLLEFPDFPDLPATDLKQMELFQITPFFDTEQEKRYLPLLPSCESSRWIDFFTDIVRRGNDKARGIDEMIAHYGISLEETMSFGDGGNDISMLQHTAISVAMGNAKEEVKAAADYVTSSVDNNGIANALRHFGIL